MPLTEDPQIASLDDRLVEHPAWGRTDFRRSSVELRPRIIEQDDMHPWGI
jgi:hypothetical protein